MSKSIERRLRYSVPNPECRYGYTAEELKTILGDQLGAFDQWFVGQTGAVCEGRSGCGPHGFVVYRSDVIDFLAGRETAD